MLVGKVWGSSPARPRKRSRKSWQTRIKRSQGRRAQCSLTNVLQPAAAPVDPAKAAGITSRYRHTVDWVRIQNDTMYVRSEVDRIAALPGSWPIGRITPGPGEGTYR